MELFDFVSFGSALKKQRKKLGISQKMVQKITKLNPDTIRRIELGEVCPKIETLEQLSILYKFDCFDMLKSYRTSRIPYINDIIESTDQYIFNNDFRGFLKEIKALKTFIKSKEYSYDKFNIDELKQLVVFLEVSKSYERQEIGNLINSEIQLIESLKYTIPEFALIDYNKFRYSYLESRILLLLALIISKQKKSSDNDSKTEFCLSVFKFLLGLYESNTIYNANKSIVCKLCFNLSYTYYRLENDLQSLKYAQKGINYALSNQIYDMLALLYYREGVAKYYLKIQDYTQSFESALCLLKSLKLNDRYIEVKNSIDKLIKK